MDTNVYQAPESDIKTETESQPLFYVVSPKKFFVLFISTLGIYAVYWFYKNWANYKDAGYDGGWPVARGIFSVFFTHLLFRTVNEKLEEQRKSFNGSPNALATAYVLLTLGSNLYEHLLPETVDTTWIDLLVILLIPVIAWPLYKAQLAINLLCNDLSGANNARFTPLNILFIIAGSIVWLFIFLGAFVIISEAGAGLTS